MWHWLQFWKLTWRHTNLCAMLSWCVGVYHQLPNQIDHDFVWLVVWTPLKNISQLGWFFPNIWENKKCSKPPTSCCCTAIFWTSCSHAAQRAPVEPTPERVARSKGLFRTNPADAGSAHLANFLTIATTKKIEKNPHTIPIHNHTISWWSNVTILFYVPISLGVNTSTHTITHHDLAMLSNGLECWCRHCWWVPDSSPAQ